MDYYFLFYLYGIFTGLLIGFILTFLLFEKIENKEARDNDSK